MGTRSRIGVMHGDKVKSVYCHWDGYLEFNGQILQEHYDSAKANHLVTLGDLSSLRATIGEKHKFSPFDQKELSNEEFEKQFGDMCTFYGRDRGEKDNEFKVAQNFETFLEQCYNSGAEYYYIMKDDVWYCGDTYGTTDLSTKLTLLSDALKQETAKA